MPPGLLKVASIMTGTTPDRSESSRNEVFQPTCSGKTHVNAKMPIDTGKMTGCLRKSLNFDPILSSASARANATPKRMPSAAIFVRCVQRSVEPPGQVVRIIDHPPHIDEADREYYQSKPLPVASNQKQGGGQIR
jgi:hypothetical protein